jgi:hypothetical protein
MLQHTVDSDFFKDVDDPCHLSLKKLFNLVQFSAEVTAAKGKTVDPDMLVSFADISIGKSAGDLGDSSTSALRWTNLARGLQAGVVWTVEDAETMFNACYNKDARDRLEEQNFAKIGDHELFLAEGDMLVAGPKHIELDSASESVPVHGNSLLEESRTAAAVQLASRSPARSASPWPNGKVVFCFDPDLYQQSKDAFLLAINNVQTQVPCLSFEETEVDKSTGLCATAPAILVQSSQPGCWSYVGAITNIADRHLQRVNLGRGCETPGFTMHQLGHALGLVHTYTRMDRDKFIEIHKENVDERKVNDLFPKNDVKPLSEAFDFFSIMMPGIRSFSKNGNFSITTTNPLLQKFMGQRMGFSHGDIDLLGSIYQCPREVKPSAESAELSGLVSLGKGLFTDHSCKNKPHTGLLTRDEGVMELRPASCWDLEAKCRHDHFGVSLRNLCPLTCLMCVNADTSDPAADANKLLANQKKNVSQSHWLKYYEDIEGASLMAASPPSEAVAAGTATTPSLVDAAGIQSPATAAPADLMDSDSKEPLEPTMNLLERTRLETEVRLGDSTKSKNGSIIENAFVLQNVRYQGNESNKLLLSTNASAALCVDLRFTGIRFRNWHTQAPCSELTNYCANHKLAAYVKDACPRTCGLCPLLQEGIAASHYMRHQAMHCMDGKKEDAPLLTLNGEATDCKYLQHLCETHEQNATIKTKCKKTCGVCTQNFTDAASSSQAALIASSRPWMKAASASLQEEEDKGSQTEDSSSSSHLWSCARRRRMGWCLSRRRRAEADAD